MALKPKVISIPQVNSMGSGFNDVHISGSDLVLQTDALGILIGNKTVPSASYALSASYANVDSYFLKNTTSKSEERVRKYDSIFNPSNLFISSSCIFIIEPNADYYVLGDLVNSGSIVVDGTLKIGGILYNAGSMTGIGIIE